MSFQCDKCGACCRLISAVPELDRGDGVCKFLSEDNTCSIYPDRPTICRVDDMYELLGKGKLTREEYYQLNYTICQQLKSMADTMPTSPIVADTSALKQNDATDSI